MPESERNVTARPRSQKSLNPGHFGGGGISAGNSVSQLDADSQEENMKLLLRALALVVPVLGLNFHAMRPGTQKPPAPAPSVTQASSAATSDDSTVTPADGSFGGLDGLTLDTDTVLASDGTFASINSQPPPTKLEDKITLNLEPAATKPVVRLEGTKKSGVTSTFDPQQLRLSEHAYIQPRTYGAKYGPVPFRPYCPPSNWQIGPFHPMNPHSAPPMTGQYHSGYGAPVGPGYYRASSGQPYSSHSGQYQPSHYQGYSGQGSSYHSYSSHSYGSYSGPMR